MTSLGFKKNLSGYCDEETTEDKTANKEMLENHYRTQGVRWTSRLRGMVRKGVNGYLFHLHLHRVLLISPFPPLLKVAAKPMFYVQHVIGFPGALLLDKQNPLQG